MKRLLARVGRAAAKAGRAVADFVANEGVLSPPSDEQVINTIMQVQSIRDLNARGMLDPSDRISLNRLAVTMKLQYGALRREQERGWGSMEEKTLGGSFALGRRIDSEHNNAIKAILENRWADDKRGAEFYYHLNVLPGELLKLVNGRKKG